MRTTQKQVYQQIESLERQLGIEGFIHLAPQYGYYTLQMYTLDKNGNKDTGVITIASGLGLGEVSQALSIAIELNYQSSKLIAELEEHKNKITP